MKKSSWMAEMTEMTKEKKVGILRDKHNHFGQTGMFWPLST
jgi:hypothetical protein